MRLVLPVHLAFVVLRELRQLHAVDTNSNLTELFSHVFNQALLASLIDFRLGKGGGVLVLGSEMAHFSVLNSSLGVFVRFKIGFILLKFL